MSKYVRKFVENCVSSKKVEKEYIIVQINALTTWNLYTVNSIQSGVPNRIIADKGSFIYAS